MTEHCFFDKKGPFRLAELAQKTSSALIGDGQIDIHDIAPLDAPNASGAITLFHNSKYAEQLKHTSASAVVLTPEAADMRPAHTSALVSQQPLKVFSQIMHCFYQERIPEAGRSAHASIHDTANIADSCHIAAGAVISEHASIGAHTVIGPHVVIGPYVTIGAHTHVAAHVSIMHAHVGHHVHIKPGARIGQSGFGFFMGAGASDRLSQPQIGRVIIGDHVEIGANTTIDRGSMKDTIIANYARIDNLVQIAHNVHIGEGCVLAAQVGISGSTRLEKQVVCGGQVGLAGHLTLGAGARVAAQSGVMRTVAPGQAVGGTPAAPVQDWLRQVAFLKRHSLHKKGPKHDA